MAWDDSGTSAAVSVSFDNLGEASEIEMGAWPDDAPLGEHFSVVEILPLVLDLLDRHDIEATFFVEGLNAEIYPDALKELAARGHEVGLHAWRHENWGGLEPARERELLERGTGALRSLSIEPRGFRPPGGLLTAQTAGLLGELGYEHVSPAGQAAGVADGLAVLPFRWRLIDAYYYLPNFSGLRERNGDPADAMPPAQLRDALLAALDRHAAGGGHLALLFHPFLVSIDRDEVLGVLSDVFARIRQLDRDGALRYLRMDRAARLMLERPAQYGPPELDESSWM